MLDLDTSPSTYLDSLYADLRGYEAQAAIIEAQIAAGDDSEWNTRRLKGFVWNIQVTRNKIAREEQRAATLQP